MFIRYMVRTNVPNGALGGPKVGTYSMYQCTNFGPRAWLMYQCTNFLTFAPPSNHISKEIALKGVLAVGTLAGRWFVHICTNVRTFSGRGVAPSELKGILGETHLFAGTCNVPTHSVHIMYQCTNFCPPGPEMYQCTNFFCGSLRAPAVSCSEDDR